MTQGCSQSPERRYARAVERGKALLERHDAARAILEFRNAAQARPKEAEAHYLLAQAYLAARDFKEAAAALRRASEVSPDYAPAQVQLAELMMMTHNRDLTKDAESRLRRILIDNPSDNDALYVLAATQVQLGNAKEAETYLTQIVQSSPQNLRSAIALAQLKASQKDFQSAEQILKNAVRQLPDSPHAAVALGMVDAWMGNTAEAKTLLQRAVQLDGNNPAALQALGALLVKTGDLAGAESMYKRLAASSTTEHRLAYAMFLMQQKRLLDAVGELERLFKTDPDDRVVRSAMVAGYLVTNRTAEAGAVLRDALRKNPSDVDALVQRSQIHLRDGKYEEAQKDLEDIMHHSPSAQAHFLMAKVYKQRGAIVQQKHELNEALRLAPESLLPRLDLAEALLLSNSARAALDTLEAATDQQKRTLEYVVARNWALIALGEQAEARKGVDTALAVSRTPDVLLQDGLLKLDAHNVPGMRTALEQVLKADPEDLRALSLLVNSYMSRKQSAVALQKIHDCVALRPNSIRLRIFLASWLLQNDREAEGRRVLQIAKAMAPRNSVPDLLLAGLDMRAGKYDDARRTLNSIIAIEPVNLEAHMMLGDIEDAAERSAEAVAHYRKVLDLQSDNVRALNNIAYDLSHDPAQLDQALRYAQLAKERAPENSQIQDTLGWIYYRKGLYSMAASELEPVVSKQPSPTVKFHLGLVYRKVGRFEEGQRLLADALAADPALARKHIPQ